MGGQPAARLLANGHDFIEKTHKRNDSKHKHNIHSKQYERQTERETDRRHTNTVTIRQILCQTLSQAVRRHPNKFPLAVRLAISMTVSLSTPLSSPLRGNCGIYIYQQWEHETLFIKIAVSVGGFRDKSRCFELSTAALRLEVNSAVLPGHDTRLPSPPLYTAFQTVYWQRFVGLISRECGNLLPSCWLALSVKWERGRWVTRAPNVRLLFNFRQHIAHTHRCRRWCDLVIVAANNSNVVRLLLLLGACLGLRSSHSKLLFMAKPNWISQEKRNSDMFCV